MKKIENLLIVLNKQKPAAFGIAERLAGVAAENGVSAELHSEFPAKEKSFKGKDAVCVIGGDGTLLSCLNCAVKYDLPVFGINLGKLGFLATFSDISNEAFLKILEGDCRIIERNLLQAKLSSRPREHHIALNDFVVKSASMLKMVSLRAYVDGEFIADYSADGLIFSTPTGSTAYNLSAGGPLIHPKAKVFAMTPICPHTLSNRSLVLSCDSKVRIECEGEKTSLLCDGCNSIPLKKGESLDIFPIDKSIKFIRPKGHMHFSILRSKLGWAENPRAHSRRLR